MQFADFYYVPDGYEAGRVWPNIAGKHRALIATRVLNSGAQTSETARFGTRYRIVYAIFPAMQFAVRKLRKVRKVWKVRHGWQGIYLKFPTTDDGWAAPNPQHHPWAKQFRCGRAYSLQMTMTGFSNFPDQIYCTCCKKVRPLQHVFFPHFFVAWTRSSGGSDSWECLCWPTCLFVI